MYSMVNYWLRGVKRLCRSMHNTFLYIHIYYRYSSKYCECTAVWQVGQSLVPIFSLSRPVCEWVQNDADSISCSASTRMALKCYTARTFTALRCNLMILFVAFAKCMSKTGVKERYTRAETKWKREREEKRHIAHSFSLYLCLSLSAALSPK